MGGESTGYRKDFVLIFLKSVPFETGSNFPANLRRAHNHPSANITPSTQDKQFTEELCDAGKLMEIKVVDHVIIGDNEYFSFADEGIM